MRKPGKVHYNALVHLLQYLRDNNNYGVRFFSDYSTLPLCRHLQVNNSRHLQINNMLTDQQLTVMSDSSWNEDVDTGRSTG
jgi:hypothetical protein